jgi:branched-chain amino acid transport system permease protein
MLALGLNIVVGYAGLLDLGYVAFYAVGAYWRALASPHLTEQLRVIKAMFPNGLHTHLAGHPAGGLLAAGAGMLLGAPTLKLRGTTWPSSPWASARSSACS